MAIASCICLCCRKANCYEEIWFDRMGFRRSAMILAVILYRQLQRDMGLKSLKEVGWSDSGMRAIKVDLMVEDNLPLLLQSSTTLSKSSPRISKKAI